MDAPNIRTVSVEGWPLAFLPASPEEPRVRDLDLAERLGYERPRKIRELIARLEEAGKISGVCRRPTVGLRGFAEEIIDEAWLTEEQALWIVTQSETAEAAKLTGIMIRVFRAVVRGELPAQAPALTRRACITFLVNEAMAEGKDGAAVAFLNAARALEKGQLPLVDVGPAQPREPKPVDLAPYVGRLLAASSSARHPMRSEELVRLAGGKSVRVRAALALLLQEGRLVKVTHQGHVAITVPTAAEVLQ